MKRLVFFLAVLMIGTTSVFGQKPKLGKIENMLKDGEIAEAKDMADLAIDYEKTKDNPKSWYLRALVYVAIDTSSTFNGLSDNPMEIAMQSFAKCDELSDEGKEEFIAGPNGFPVTKTQHVTEYYTYYFNKAASAFGDEDFAGAVDYFALSAYIMPEDTNAYINGGYAAVQAENYEAAKTNFYKALEMDVTSKDVRSLLLYIVTTIDDDKEKGLEVVKEARMLYPSDSEFARQEINLMIQTERIDEAKNNLISAIEKEPNDANLHFTLGILYEEIAAKEEDEAVKKENMDLAKASYVASTNADPDYYNAHYNIGVMMITEANIYIKQSNALGVSKADMKKSEELEPLIQQKLKESLPTWEKIVELKDDDVPALQTLSYLYTQLKMYDEAEAVMAKIDALGGDDE